MRRTACVDLPHFPLQLLLRRHPDWREAPVAVVDQDRPQGTILWVNERARALRILPGMRYAAGLSLAGKLRAAPVPRAEIEREVTGLVRRLQRFTPHVEPAREEPGVFWLDASGLERLHDSLRDWGREIRAELKRIGFESSVAVGFLRFGSYALARSRHGLVAPSNQAEERAAARRVALDRLALPPAAREALAKLGIATVGAFVDLPLEGIGRRFGPELERLHRLASGDLGPPLQPEHLEPPVVERRALEQAETAVLRLVALIERMLEPLLEQIGRRGRAVTEIRLGLRFERLGDHIETVRPAAPTLDAGQLLELIRLRLQAVRRLPDGVEEVILVAGQTPASERQLQLFAERARRDPQAAGRALARVRAALGDGAVVRARLREGHLPEGSFAWEPLADLPAPAPSPVDRPRLIRRIVSRPLPLPPRPRQEPDGWMLRGLQHGPVARVHGPYVVSGGWWNRQVHREYHFAETRAGELLWVYYDRARRRWFLQGRVE